MKPRPQAELLPTHTPALFDAAVRRASELLGAGEVVALPTETVYGLAANAWNAGAVSQLYEIKGRPVANPIIVHVGGIEQARRCVRAWPEAADRLASAFWPGPLTLVLERAALIPDVVTAGGDTVGIRWSSHPFIQAVIRACGFPLAAPSANRSNQISPTNASHVQESLGTRIPLIVDGGQSQVGIESTVLDLTERPTRILRPGMIHAESLAAVLGSRELVVGPTPMSGSDPGAPGVHGTKPLRSPGQLERHYAPRARLLLLRWRDDEDLRAQLASLGCASKRCAVLAYANIPSSQSGWLVSVVPHDAEAYARALYAEMHRCDAERVDCLVIEALPDGPEWQGIADRLRRAASPSRGCD
ncbi:MAG TPA: L-threonylcarbamoyladenylate synthase [Verrucomicrobiae bacterium]|nr:L-threonylcarbamoyladenylate synthase [Verrucomicrobiae bacterium]